MGRSTSALQRCAGGQINTAQNIGRKEGGRTVRRRRHRWENDYVRSIHQAHGRNYWQDILKTKIKFWILLTRRN